MKGILAELKTTRRREPSEKVSAVSQEKRPRGRPPKYPSNEVRRRLIDAAVARLRVRGVESGLDAVTLDGAILDADVPRGMSYKIWRVEEETPQDAFRHATVLALLSIPAVAGLPMTKQFAVEQIDKAREALESSDALRRQAALSHLIRTVGHFNHHALAQSADWRLYTALRAAAITRPDTDPAVMKALIDGEKFLIEEYSAFYTEMASTVGLALRSEYSMDEFSSAAYSLNEGLSMRLADTFQASGIVGASDDAGETWSLFAIALEALIVHFFEWT